jgi:hypothetical protein
MSFHYLGTPYSRFKGGLDAAFRMASEATAKLIRARVPVFSPIVHSHPVAQMGGLDPLDWQLWLAEAEPFIRAACGLLIYKAPGWRRSFGIAQEVKAFRAMKKPVRAITPASINDAGVHAVLRYAAIESHANARDEDVGYGTKEPTLERASRLDARRSASATSETMDVTAGETALHSPVAQSEERNPPESVLPSGGVEVAGSSPAGSASFNHEVIEAAATNARPAEEFEIPAFLRRQPASAEAAQP